MNHLSGVELRNFMERDLPPVELLEWDDHLAGCTQCRTAVEREAHAEDDLASLAAALATPQTHLEYAQIRMLAEGESIPTELAAHASACRICSNEVAELRQFAAQLAATPRTVPPPERAGIFHGRLHLAFAGLVLAACVAAVLMVHFHGSLAVPRISDTVASLHNGRMELALDRAGQLYGAQDVAAQYQDQMKAAMLTGRVVSTLPTRFGGRSPETMLGSPLATSSFRVISPASEVLMDDRPTFRWQPLSEAASYHVTIYDAAYRKIQESHALQQATWRAEAPLPRGAIYTWTVTAQSAHGVAREPSPPQPEAAFQIMTAETATELRDAARSYAGNPLLLAVLYAHAGAIDEARAQLNLLVNQNPGNGLAARLQASLAADTSGTQAPS
ncbi:MAG TPA: tetratricopeptide repeat protein, partial [Terracidiphilus sp.]|nr:tetratricopeptide repeat protein [Terracidiphilus sp.]